LTIPPSILINASNLHSGGGVQVACSFIYELSLMGNLPNNFFIWCSSEVDLNLRSLNCNLKSFSNYSVVNTYGLKLIFSSYLFRLQSFDCVFTIFGPLYSPFLSGFNISGFAQAWAIYPNNDAYQKLTFIKRLSFRLKYKLQLFFFKKSDHFVVELDHVKKSLLRLGIGSSDSISIINNSLSSLYFNKNIWEPFSPPIFSQDSSFKFGFVGSNYPHKNLDIFPSVIDTLSAKFNISISIYVTLSESEWSSCSPYFRSKVINVGRLRNSQCPYFYDYLDAVIFPSLLECFSATPLEALYMKKPLFVSDRPFNRDICSVFGFYFDPLSPSSLAYSIYTNFFLSSPSTLHLERGKVHAINFSSPSIRAKKYFSLLSDI